MKNCRRRVAALLTVVMETMLLAVQAFAAGSIDLQREVSLTISSQYNEMPLAGAAFSVYLVSEADETGELRPVDAFSEFPVDIRGENDEAWRALASTLAGYVLRDQVAFTASGITDSQGLLTFSGEGGRMVPGLYLVCGSRHMKEGFYYDTVPFMVMLPGLDKENNDWVYDMTVKPKYSVVSEPETVTRKALKVWKDSGREYRRPQEVTVQLLRDGEIHDTVVLNAENNWRYTWEGLDNSASWTLVEKEVQNYTVSVTQEGITFVVTNTYRPSSPGGGDLGSPGGGNPGTPVSEIPDGEVPAGAMTEIDEGQVPLASLLPQTGQLWWPGPLLVAGGLLLIVIGLAGIRGADNEKKQ